MEAPLGVSLLAATLVRSPSGRLELPAPAEAKLRSRLRAAPPSEALWEEVVELVRFALFLDEREGAGELARLLLDIAGEATPALERHAAAHALAEGSAQAERRAVLGEVGALHAPGASEPAPAGSVHPTALLIAERRRRGG